MLKTVEKCLQERVCVEVEARLQTALAGMRQDVERLQRQFGLRHKAQEFSVMPSGHKTSGAEELLPLEPKPEALEKRLEPSRAPRVPLAVSSHARLWVPAALLAAATGACVLAVPQSAAGARHHLRRRPPTQRRTQQGGPHPVLALPTQVVLRSVHGHFVAAERNGVLVANRPWADDWEKFAVLDLGEGDVALQSFHGSFVRVDAAGVLSATAPSWGAEGASFQTTFAADDSLELKSSSGKYISADADGTMRADKSELSQSTEFEVFDVADTWPAHVAVKTAHGKYLSSKVGGHVAADGQWPLDNWKRLRVTRHPDGKLSLQFDHGEYLSVWPDGSLQSSPELENTEKFTVTHLDDGKFTMQDHQGRFVCAGPDGTLKLQSTDAGEASEKLEVVFLP